jgi:hypothetical protein
MKIGKCEWSVANGVWRHEVENVTENGPLILIFILIFILNLIPN